MRGYLKVLATKLKLPASTQTCTKNRSQGRQPPGFLPLGHLRMKSQSPIPNSMAFPLIFAKTPSFQNLQVCWFWVSRVRARSLSLTPHTSRRPGSQAHNLQSPPCQLHRSSKSWTVWSCIDISVGMNQFRCEMTIEVT